MMREIRVYSRIEAALTNRIQGFTYWGFKSRAECPVKHGSLSNTE